MKQRVYGYFCLLIIGTVLFTSIIISYVMHQRLYATVRQTVVSETNLLKDVLEQSPAVDLTVLARNPDLFRITLFSQERTVLFDNSNSSSVLPADEMLTNPEVLQAFDSGSSERIYFASGIQYQTFSATLRLTDGSVIRVEKVVESLFRMIIRNRSYLFFLILLIFFGSNFLANRLIREITAPVNNLNLDELSLSKVDDVFSPLVRRILGQQIRFDRQIKEARKRQIEFSLVLQNMREGLIVLNSNANIITINKSALNYFGAKDGDYIDKSIYMINRRAGLQSAIEKALMGEPAEELIFVNSRYLQLLVSPISEDAVVQGIILLVMDVTEKHDAEVRRREFSANVSHELKTPLTTISGYAELLKNGLVKPPDVYRFSERIYIEATRMSELISDIITLSRLDERQIDLPFEHVDLYQLMTDISGRFTDSARERDITISLSGQSSVIYGIRRILEEMLFNICDNALKYNLDGGRIDISVSEGDDFIMVSVSDTGIGIPEEEQDRVFERFYRVEKSHSKQTGGTGLGLSIAKHGALVHSAKIILESTPNVGTTIRIRFPKH